MSDPLPPNPEAQKPEPIPLDYFKPEKAPNALATIFVFVVGMAIGFAGLWILMAFAVMALSSAPGRGMGLIITNFVIAIGAFGVIFKLQKHRGKYWLPFVEGLLAGICVAALLDGVCFANVMH